MIKRSLEELKTYEAPGHFDMCAMKVHMPMKIIHLKRYTIY
jgi:hypothetical protein